MAVASYELKHELRSARMAIEAVLLEANKAGHGYAAETAENLLDGIKRLEGELDREEEDEDLDDF